MVRHPEDIKSIAKILGISEIEVLILSYRYTMPLSPDAFPAWASRNKKIIWRAIKGHYLNFPFKPISPGKRQYKLAKHSLKFKKKRHSLVV